tara:strand:- start:16150 stop:16932 length:783 start_codon:yes stop_codon:yes gene_type:complete
MLKLPKYDRITILLFRELTKGFNATTLPNIIPFSKEKVVDVMSKAVKDGIIDKAVKNVADIKYTYDARRDLPLEVEQAGRLVWLGTKKGHYKFERASRRNLIDLPINPAAPPVVEHVMDQTPPSIARLLGNDEQAAFTRVRNAGILTTFIGFHVWPIQGHQRTSVSYGQVEIDEVHAGLAPGRKLTVVPVSGKGGQDKLSFSQALSLNTFGAEKFRKHNVAVRSLGLWRDKAGHIWLIEFSPETDIHQIRIIQVRRFEIT